MQTCNTGLFELSIPDNWEDRSMITWVAPPSPRYKVLPNVLISKSRMLPAEDLPAFVNRQLKELMSKVGHFELLRRGDTELSGRPAVELVFSMKPQNILLMQRQIFFNSPGEAHMVHTVVATSAKDDWPTLESDFDGIFRSLNWND